jgi:membrane-bound inhibitor of C-type lysozyme
MPIDLMPPCEPATPWRVVAALAVAALAACSSSPTKEELEAARNTFACQLGGERLVIRFDSGEARLLMPGGDRVTLYQIAAASGVRFTNGLMELRGKGMELQLVRDGTATILEGCQPHAPPPK